MKVTYIHVSLLLLLFACRKEAPMEFGDCGRKKFNPDTYGGCGDCNKILEDTIYRRLCFNPNDNKEAVCVVSVNNSTDWLQFPYLLVKITIGQPGWQVLAENAYDEQPTWSRCGWILYGAVDRQIWRVKPDGDSLQQVTGVGYSFVPSWSPDCSRFASFYWTDDVYRIVIRDAAGSLLDTLPFEGEPQWSPDGDKMIIDGVTYVHMSHPDQKITLSTSGYGAPDLNPGQWSSDSKGILWRNMGWKRSPIYHTSLIDEVTSIIFEPDECDYVYLFAVSGDGRYLLCTEEHRIVQNPDGIYYQKNLHVSTRLVLYDMVNDVKVIVRD